MNPTLIVWLKRLLIPGLLVMAHALAENLPSLAALIPAKYGGLGALVVFVGGAILHALPPPSAPPVQ